MFPTKKEEQFVQEYLYIEEYLPPVEEELELDIDNNKIDSENKRGVVIIEII